MATATQIIDGLGGTSAVARSLEVGPTVVSNWKRYNSIPEWRRSALLELAVKLGVELSTGDFPKPSERIARRVA